MTGRYPLLYLLSSSLYDSRWSSCNHIYFQAALKEELASDQIVQIDGG